MNEETGSGSTGGRALGLAYQLARVPGGRRSLASALLTGSVAATSGVALLATSAWLITTAARRPPVLELSLAIGAVQAFALGRGLARYAMRLRLHDVALRALGALRVALYDLVEPLVPGGLPGRGSGSLLGAIVGDADAIGESFVRGLGAAIELGAAGLAGCAAVALVDLRLGAVLAAGTSSTVAVSWLASRSGRRAAAAEVATRGELADGIVAWVRAAPELHAFGRVDLVRDGVERLGRRSGAANRRSATAAAAGRALAAATGGATLAVVLGLGDVDVGRRRLGEVMFAVVAFVALAVLDAGTALPDALLSRGRGAAARADLDALGRRPPAPEPDRPAPAPRRPAGSALEDAVVEREGATVLDGVSLAVGAGRRVALLGPSGSGKSTAVLTLLHFLECASGVATLGGRDVRTLPRPVICDHAGWVPETTHVFARSVRANLGLAAPDAADGVLLAALRRVGLGPWFETLPAGLDTPLGSGGVPTSAGERQRLGLARALLRAPDVLLLDEPTAHLDPEGGRAALDELLEAAGGRAVLVVTHDEAIAAALDTTVRLERGRVASRSPSSEPSREA